MTPTRHIKRSLLTALLPFLMVLLLTLLGCGGFQYTGIGTPTSGFDATPYALQIAREAYRVRKNRAPTGHDFGGGIIVVQYTDGSKPSEIASKIYEGYNNPSPSGDKNATHSERRTEDDFVLPTLAILKSHGTVAKASEIDVIIFTQFYPCETCLPEMSAWQNQERLAAGSANVYLTVWTLTKSFYPLDRNPRRWAQPVIRNESDIQKVSINFDAPITPTP